MEIPKEVIVWQFGGIKGNIRSENNYQNNKGYNLFCSTNKKNLIWKRGMVSINFDYSSSPQYKFHLHLPDKRQREILTGETFALANGGGDPYLFYKERKIGINLNWGSKPSFEWRIFTASGKIGEPIPEGTFCALVNLKVSPKPDFLIFLEKHVPKEVDLGWTTSPTWKETWGHIYKDVEKARKYVMTAVEIAALV